MRHLCCLPLFTTVYKQFLPVSSFIYKNKMPETLPPKSASRHIAENAKHVFISDAGVQQLAKEISNRLISGTLSFAGFSQAAMHPKILNDDAVDWIFVIDTLNFCFWSADQTNKWTITYQGKPYTGYFALCAAVNRALDEGYKITTPSYYSKISEKDLTHILRGDDGTPMVQLIKERVDCLHEVGNVLMEKYEGTFVKVLKKGGTSAEELLTLITSEFKCFRDEAELEGKRVGIYKRAQILIGDIWSCGKGKGLGEFRDIEYLSMFADYRVPQVLIHFNAMSYSSDLLKLLKSDVLLENGSREEVEIRGVSIRVVDMVLDELKKLLPNMCLSPNDDENALVCNAVVIDHFLWDYRRAHAEELESIPFHKTISIYY